MLARYNIPMMKKEVEMFKYMVSARHRDGGFLFPVTFESTVDSPEAAMAEFDLVFGAFYNYPVSAEKV